MDGIVVLLFSLDWGVSSFSDKRFATWFKGENNDEPSIEELREVSGTVDGSSLVTVVFTTETVSSALFGSSVTNGASLVVVVDDDKGKIWDVEGGVSDFSVREPLGFVYNTDNMQYVRNVEK